MASSLRPLSALLLALLAPHLAAQTPAPAPANGGSLVFQGDTTRAGIGWDSDNDWRGELFHVFREDAGSAWLGELWATSESAGGAKLSYHWRPADAAADAGVRKLFGAIDQNRDRDRKVTLGGGYETERFFASGYLSAGVTGRREAGVSSASTTQTITGVEPGGRPYEQDITTTVTTRLFERAYDWGVGGRIGHFYPGPLLRVEAGLDYEWGSGSTGQTTLSLGAEKFFAGTPHSIAFGGEIYRKHGGIETDRDDARAWLMYRYSFGGAAWRPEKSYRMVEVPRQQPAVPATPAVAAKLAAPAVAPAAPATPRVEKRIVKTTASAASDLFFDLDRATLRPEAKAALDAVAARLKAAGFEGNVRVSGHTCDLGPAAYNLKLSQRRASVVRDQLIAAGVPAADRILAEGEGEANPRHPNTPSERPKNRRVDIEFVTFVEKVEEVAVAPPPAPVPPAPPAVSAPRPAPAPAVEWKQEEIATEPAWLRRALRNPAGHKQSVDVYRTESESTEVAEGPKRYLNRGPSAQNDGYAVNTDSGANAFAVLANDGDPDGDPLSIATVGAPAHGTAVVSGAQVLYTPAPGYVGADAFSYTVSDGRGGTSTATVAVTVARQNRAPVARDDYAVAGYNTPLAIDVLGNDSDPDGDALVVVSFTQPVNGLVTRGPGNTLVYRANQNYIGYDALFYEISDGKGGSARAGVTVFADP